MQFSSFIQDVLEDRHIAMDLVDEAVTAGARRFKACAVLEIDVRTLQRWKKALTGRQGLEDQRSLELGHYIPGIFASWSFLPALPDTGYIQSPFKPGSGAKCAPGLSCWISVGLTLMLR